MRKKYIHIYQCKWGDIIADDIYDNRGLIIASKDEVLDESIIKKLKTFGIRQLCVYTMQNGESAEKSGLYSMEFRRKYEENLNSLKRILCDMAVGKRANYGELNCIADSIYSKMTDTGAIIECMNEVRNTDEYIYTHSINVSIYSLLIAKWLDLTELDTRNVVMTGLLHDIGKLRIPVKFLNKKGPLLPEEYEQIKEHADIGYHLAKEIPHLTEEIQEGILMHHEREDGKGYPLGIKGNDINIYAKIISIADVYDALTSERIYKKRITPFETFNELTRMGFGYFDTEILMTFLSNISRYYIGSKVKMNNGESGKVIFIAPQSISMPIVHVKDRYIDLSQERQYKIIEML